MLDFIKDMIAEANGLDSEKMKEERRNKNKEKHIFSKSIKVIVTIVGILYLFVAVTNISICLRQNEAFIKIGKYLFLSILDLIVMVSLLLKNKKAELTALIGIVLFVLANYIFAIIQY